MPSSHRVLFAFLFVFGLFVLSMGPSQVQASKSCESSLLTTNALTEASSADQPLGIHLPEVTSDLKQAIQSGRIASSEVFFILLPGNMGSVWQHTNHNIGYDMLVDLIRHFGAQGTRDGHQDYAHPLETIEFNALEAGDDVDIQDRQEFYSEAGYSRTKDGEVFVSWGEAGQPTLVFMRRVGFYNDVGNFFIPVVREVGGRPENILLIHDDLKLPKGEILVEKNQASYNGNRAVLSVHVNLNAWSINNRFEAARNEIAQVIAGDLQNPSEAYGIVLGELFWELQKATWATVVSAKNQMDENSFRALLAKNIRPLLEEPIKKAVSQIEPEIHDILQAVQELKEQIRSAEDKREAAKRYQEAMKQMTAENPLASDYFALKNRLADLSAKKSETLHQLLLLFAQGFDPRELRSPFTRIGVGTGYEQWAVEGRADGFPPIPEVLGDTEGGGFPHFVLSPRDPEVFTEALNDEVFRLIQSIALSNRTGF